MTHRATREDTIQSIYISLSSSPLDFSPTISFPSVVQPRIEFRPSPPFTSGNKCTYDSIMRVARNRGRAKILAEERVQLSTFHFQRYTSGTPTGDRMRTDREIDQNDSSIYFAHPNIFLFFLSSPLYCFPVIPCPPPFSFSFHSRVTTFKVHFSRGLFFEIWEQVSRGGDSRRRFPTV